MTRFAPSHVATALLLSAVAADAAVVCGNRADFEAALGASFTEHYDSADYEAGDRSNTATFDIYSNSAMSAIAGQTRYRSTGFSDWNVILDAAFTATTLTGNFCSAG